MTKEYDLEEYPILINNLLKYIDIVKQTDIKNELTLSDIILEYANRQNVAIELIGDAISTDTYLKSFILKDCELHNIFQTETPDEW